MSFRFKTAAIAGLFVALPMVAFAQTGITPANPTVQQPGNAGTINSIPQAQPTQPQANALNAPSPIPQATFGSNALGSSPLPNDTFGTQNQAGVAGGPTTGNPGGYNAPIASPTTLGGGFSGSSGLGSG